jgi:hypothetical protein
MNGVMPGQPPDYGRLSTLLRHLKPYAAVGNLRIQPGSDVIVCAEMDEQWGYVGAKSLPALAVLRVSPESEELHETRPVKPIKSGGYWPNVALSSPEDPALQRRLPSCGSG